MSSLGRRRCGFRTWNSELKSCPLNAGSLEGVDPEEWIGDLESCMEKVRLWNSESSAVVKDSSERVWDFVPLAALNNSANSVVAGLL